jgi:hypothetical protein
MYAEVYMVEATTVDSDAVLTDKVEIVVVSNRELET